MSLQYVREEFVECSVCRAKPGSPMLCAECLERRELWYLVKRIRDRKLLDVLDLRSATRICVHCRGCPKPECPEHGR